MSLSMKGQRTVCRTFSGKNIQFLEPKKEDISLLDIAHHLAQANRYNGGCSEPYSVAQHCIYVASILPSELKLAGLLHDASEAVLGDVVRPLKTILDDYKKHEARFQSVVEEYFSMKKDSFDHALVHEADRRVMASEMDSSLLAWDDILEYPLAKITIEFMDWKDVRAAYLLTFHLLSLPEETQRLCLESFQDPYAKLLLPDSIIIEILKNDSIITERKEEIAQAIDTLVKDKNEHVSLVTPVFKDRKRIDKILSMAFKCLGTKNTIEPKSDNIQSPE